MHLRRALVFRFAWRCVLRAACCVVLRVCVVHLRRALAFRFAWRCVMRAACCVVLRLVEKALMYLLLVAVSVPICTFCW